MMGRLRQLLPVWAAVLFAVLFLCLEGPVLYYEWALGQPIQGLRVRPGTYLLYIGSAAYGISRAVSFHPFYRDDYRKWLELTPWTVDKPLPMGPITLVWEDGIVLGALILLTLTQPIHGSIRLLSIFLMFHSLSLMVAFWPTGVGSIGYLVAFGLGLAVRLWYYPWACFIVSTAIWLLAHEGLWRSLSLFPWSLEWSIRELSDSRLLAERIAGVPCGWPFDRFHRDIITADRLEIGWIDAVLLSLLLGFWITGIESLVTDPDARLTMAVIALSATFFVCTVARAQSYGTGYVWPLSFLGRVLTLRWIIPGYDQVFLAPIFAILSMVSVTALGLESGVPLDLTLAIATTLVALIGLIAPPRLKAWRLIGRHRIVPGISQAQSSQYVKAG
jgi:hypothetical protein